MTSPDIAATLHAAVAEVRYSGRGRTSGVPLEQRVFQVFRAREGKIAHCRSYTDEQEALEAVRASG